MNYTHFGSFCILSNSLLSSHLARNIECEKPQDTWWTWMPSSGFTSCGTVDERAFVSPYAKVRQNVIGRRSVISEPSVQKVDRIESASTYPVRRTLEMDRNLWWIRLLRAQYFCLHILSFEYSSRPDLAPASGTWSLRRYSAFGEQDGGSIGENIGTECSTESRCSGSLAHLCLSPEVEHAVLIDAHRKR